MPVKLSKAYYLLLATATLALVACNGDDPQTDTGVAADQGPTADRAITDAVGDNGGTTLDKVIAPDGPKKPAYWELLPDKDVPTGTTGTVTLLNDGRVLFAGGEKYLNNNTEYIAKCYIFDPKKKKFSVTGPMTMARAYHTATLLKDGRVLAAGGKNDSTYQKTAELYDPKTGKWTATKSMPSSRWAHAAARLNKDGMVLVTGGFGNSDSLSSMTIYHPAQKDWITPAASMNVARRYHTMTKLKSGKVLIAGGIYEGSNTWKYKTTDAMELFADDGTITKVKDPMNYPRSSHTATLVPTTGNVLIVGGICWRQSGDPPCGNKVNDLYKPASNTATKMSYLGKPPVGHTAVALKDGRVMIIGSNENDPADRKKVVTYTPGGGLTAWKNEPKMKLARSHPLAVTLNDGTVLVTAGMEMNSPRKYAEKAELYHP